ncbi:protein tesmin/TSO1-like CXC 3 [Ziziphus jujuba]|uniref:Protein tesmin/TSO1-like CXC 3 n=1 Tax=Ziziphus jujuba TaxID=326968 RepID=A0A6P4A3G4_ZIZJJ|nr:protein tesmin/TSO1-like CXC 3 [Ziziphus jujuba]
MDTPERNQIGTPLSKFEDSPVFNYINSLSPIKPVKSLNITQTFSSLSFATLPSVFTSPHVSSHRESRFLRRHNSSDPSKRESSPEIENKVCTNEGVVIDSAHLYNNRGELNEIGETSVEPQSGHSKFVIELPRTLKYDCGSPDCDSTPCDITADCASELIDPSTALVPYVQEASERCSSGGEAHANFQGACQIGLKKEGNVCDWESLISDAADLLIFNSPGCTEPFKGLIENSLEPATRFCTSVVAQFPENDMIDGNRMHVVDPVSVEHHNTEDLSTQPREACQMTEMEMPQDRLANTNSNKGVVRNPTEIKDNEVEACMAFSCKSVFNLHRGIRRRCLDFEMAGARRKNLDDGSNCSSSISQSDEKITANDTQLGSVKPGSDSTRRILPGIGLHLNALAATSKDYVIIKSESFSSGRQPSLPNTTASIHSPTDSQEPLDKSLILASSERDTDGAENGVLLEDGSQAPAISEEFNQNSPKKKRRRLENAGEGDSCKRCNCKKSKCLKLYCECFAAGVYCIEPCSCQDCFNKPIHEDTVLATRKQIESRNPLAFAPKVIRSSDSVPEFGDESNKTPASARHKRGCNCKKSSCTKKYCECYQGGVGCSISCRCEGCKNAFGKKDGSALTGTEAEPEEDETEASEKSMVDKPLQKIEIQNNEEQNPSSTLPITPLQASRVPLIPLPLSSKSKPPRSSFFTMPSSSGLYTGQKLGKPNILRSQPRFEKHIQVVPKNQEDEMPEILRGDSSPNTTGIKTSSPNSKRISPPHCNFGSSPGRRTGRKLILQSIPSFPSLTPRH